MKTNSQNQAEIYIDGEIVDDQCLENDTSAISFRNDLKLLGDVDIINLHINSPGGSVFTGISIFNQLKQHKAEVNVYVDGLAASIASVIVMAGDNIYMPANTMLMIHNPWTIVQGNASELRKQADELDIIANVSMKTYLDRSGGKLEEQQLKEMLDNETWLSADEAVAYGLADEVLATNKIAASINNDFKQIYKHIPESISEKNKCLETDFREYLVKNAIKSNKLLEQYIGG